MNFNLDRLLEDIFAPMSGPEQAEADKEYEAQFTYVEGITVGIQDNLDNKVGSAVQDLLIKLGFRMAEAMFSQLEENQGWDWYHIKKDHFEDPQKYLRAIEKKLKDLGVLEAPPITYESGWEGDNFHAGYMIKGYKAERPYDSKFGILFRWFKDKIRKKWLSEDVKKDESKKLAKYKITGQVSEDLFKPMKGRELKDVEAKFEVTETLQVGVPSYIGSRILSSINAFMIDSGFIKSKDPTYPWQNRVWYELTNKKIPKWQSYVNGITGILKKFNSFEDVQRTSPLGGISVVRQEFFKFSPTNIEFTYIKEKKLKDEIRI